jgi:hypothetical protein
MTSGTAGRLPDDQLKLELIIVSGKDTYFTCLIPFLNYS